MKIHPSCADARIPRAAAFTILLVLSLLAPSASPLAGGCDPVTLTLTGSSATDGDDGNVRSYSAGGISVKVSAFSRTKGAPGTWAPGFLGAYSLGLGVTDSGESATDPAHTVDNSGRLNFVLFEFSAPVVVDKAYLGYVSGDSDVTAWIGTLADPFNNHVTLSDDILAGCITESSTGGSTERWADLNAGGVAGNVLVMAALTSDSDDYFKIKQLAVCVPTGPTYDYGDLTTTGTSFNTSGAGTPANAPRHLLGGTLKLGAVVDAESNGQPSSQANGDDSVGTGDDEDGVSFGTLTAGAAGTVTVTVTGDGGKLNAWIDWNNDGAFGAGEQVAANVAMGAGANLVPVTVPSGAAAGVSLAARFRLSSAGGDSATAGTAADGEIEDHRVTVVVSGGVCTTTSFLLTGSSSTDGDDGNVRTFAAQGVSVKVTAFSRTKGTSGTWAPAFLGAYGSGLGVTDSAESGADPGHTVDNYNRLNYVLFEFSTPVIVDKAYLGYVSGDSDLTAWVGTFDDPYNNHLTLSDAVLAACGTTEDNAGGGYTRWADLNAGQVSGNVLVIAALPADAGDFFKLKELTVCVPSAPSYDYGDLPVAGATFNTDGGGVPAQAPRHTLGGLLTLGSQCDAEANGQPSDGADADDLAGTADDEDGVEFGPLTAGLDGAVTVTVTGTGGKLNAWVDWNNDGQFGAGEQIAASAAMSNGPNLLTVSVPVDAFVGAPLGARFRLSQAGNDAATGGTAADGEIEDHVVTVEPPSAGCVTTTVDLTGGTSSSGSSGNVRTFVADGVSVKVTAFSRTKGSTGTWAEAYLGQYSYGLGVTDAAESGASGSHTVDNYDRLNYVLFEFSQPVIVDRAYLGYVSGDSDLTAWVGTFTHPFDNHLTLSDAVLGDCDVSEDNLGGSAERWADLNAGGVAGNVLIIAALTSGSNDYFKIKELTVCVPTPPSHDYGDLPVAGTTFNTDGLGDPNVALDASSHGTTGSGTTASTLTVAHTTGAGSDRLMLVGVAVGNSSNFQYDTSEVTYGGIPLTFVGRVLAPTGGGGPGGGTGYSRPQVEIWALANPAPGTANVVVTLGGSRAFGAGVTTFAGVDLSNGLASALGSFASNSANSGSAADVTLATTAGQWVYDVVATANIGTAGSDPSVFSPASGQTQAWTEYARGGTTPALRLRSAAGTVEAGGGSLTVTETSTTSYPWAIGAVPINGARDVTAPRHVIEGSLVLGTRRDAEANGQPTAGADGDDLNPAADDEDGVAFGALVAGQSGAITVTASVNGGKLNAWIDWNNDGSFGAGEQVAANVPLNAGPNVLTIAVPLGAANGVQLAARFRLSTAGNDGPTNGTAADGEIEDYLVTVGPAGPLDFGDAPTAAQSGRTSSYPTLLADGAACHSIVTGFLLGVAIDAESNGQPDLAAVGDDAGGAPPDDEDGVFLGTIKANSSATATVRLVNTAGLANPRLDAWIDWNRDGDWDDAGEQIFVSQPLASGVNILTYAVPAGITPGSTYARFRLSTGGGLLPGGLAADGEVEDYLVSTQAQDETPFDWGDLPDTYGTASLSGGPRHAIVSGIRLGDLIDAESDGQPTAGASGDDAALSDDEDGVSFGALARGQALTITYTVADNASPGPALLNAWIDWDASGTFESGEQIALDVTPANRNGANTLVLTVPMNAVTDTPLGARFRLSTQAGLTPTGAAGDGEVEDYVVRVSAPPTAARLAQFQAVRGNSGEVRLSWGTLVEFDTLGFRIERSSPDGGWTRLTGGLIPARGHGYQPQQYRMVDQGDGAQGAVGYRLSSVDLQGREQVLAEVRVREAASLSLRTANGALQIEFRGEPNGTASIETTVDPVMGQWELVDTVTLDAAGGAIIAPVLTPGEPMRFYRVRE